MKPAGLVVLTLAMLFAVSAHAMHCGTRIVKEGDSAPDVLRRCGEPEHVEQSVDYRYRSAYYGYAPNLVPVTIEVWTYNFGPNRLMRRLRFEDGELKSIRTLGYGHHKPRQ